MHVENDAYLMMKSCGETIFSMENPYKYLPMKAWKNGKFELDPLSLEMQKILPFHDPENHLTMPEC